MNASHEKPSLHQFVSLVLSIYVLGALIFETTCKVSAPTLALLDKIDFFICFFFLYDFTLRFYQAESKLRFMKWGWIDLISSIPFWGVFQWARVVRVVRILRALRSTKILVSFIYRDTGLSSLVSAALIATLMMIFCSIAVLNFENAPNSNIKDADDALWWAFTTISTVGYGDKYPVTPEGRLTAAVLILCGVGLFGVYTGYIAKLFVSDEIKEENHDVKKLSEEIRLLRLQLQKLTQVREPIETTDDEEIIPDFAPEEDKR
jgi:voltage-gated potassium channel